MPRSEAPRRKPQRSSDNPEAIGEFAIYLLGGMNFKLADGRQTRRPDVMLAYWNERDAWQPNPLFSANPIDIIKSKRFPTQRQAIGKLEFLRTENPQATLIIVRFK